jgi:hypothetical protein
MYSLAMAIGERQSFSLLRLPKAHAKGSKPQGKEYRCYCYDDFHFRSPSYEHIAEVHRLSRGVDAYLRICHLWSMTNVQQMVLAIEAELKGKGIPVCDLTTEAGIVPSTWTRWKSGSNSPTLKAWNETLEAKARLIKRGKK